MPDNDIISTRATQLQQKLFAIFFSVDRRKISLLSCVSVSFVHSWALSLSPSFVLSRFLFIVGNKIAMIFLYDFAEMFLPPRNKKKADTLDFKSNHIIITNEHTFWFQLRDIVESCTTTSVFDIVSKIVPLFSQACCYDAYINDVGTYEFLPRKIN